MQKKGETRGDEFLSIKKYIEQRHGRESLRLVEEEMTRIGYPLSFEEAASQEWFSEPMFVLTLLTAKRLLGWQNLFDIGYSSPKFSLGIRLFMKFSSMKRVFEECAKTWNKFMNFGQLEPYQFSEEKKYAVLRLKGYDLHPEMCEYYRGLFLRIAQYVKKAKEITTEETACLYKGAKYHEYMIKWR